MSPQEQEGLVKQIGLAIINSAPQEWQKIRTEFRAAGRYFELASEVTGADGAVTPWTASQDIAMIFARLRAGMHSEPGGTWFNARYTIERPASYNLEFDRAEPQWRTPPPPAAYRDELRFFPRSDDDVPEWLMRRLSGISPERPGHRFRIARIFDRPGPDGRPTVDRPQVDQAEREQLLAYLDRCTMILPVRGHDIDRLATDARQSVPVAFHSDGSWIWPAAVNYYLRGYGIPPEQGLVQHARANGFVPQQLDEQTTVAAAVNITGSRPAAPPQAPASRAAAAVPPPAAPPAAAMVPPTPPPAEAPRRESAPASEGPVLGKLRATLAELGVANSAYRIAEPPAENTWYLEQVEEGWQVGWYEREFSTPVLFDDSSDAAAFLLGKLLLQPSGATSREQQAPEVTERPDGGARTPPFGLPQADEVHADQAHADQAHGPETHGDQAHGDQAHGDQAHGDQAPLREDVPDDEAMATEPAAASGKHSVEAPLPDAAHAVDEVPAGAAHQMAQQPEFGETPEAPEHAEPHSVSAAAVLGGSAAVGGVAASAITGSERASAEPVGAEAVRPQDQRGWEPEQTAGGGGVMSTDHQDERREPATQHGADQQPEQAAGWPIQPTQGEPPLTLFRGKRMIEAPAGTELDRHGDANGNLTYSAGTPFGQRSLPENWRDREYHLYQVQRPLRVLSGEAIPWFDQEGGGTAVLLPQSVAELLAAGDLAEIEPEPDGGATEGW
ncbi:MAG: glycohydrolase toxin TNT-related protein [Sciscionella sp.]